MSRKTGENLPNTKDERAHEAHRKAVEEWLTDPVTKLFLEIIAAEAYAAREETADLALVANAKAFASAAKLEFARWVLDDGKDGEKGNAGGALRILASLDEIKQHIGNYIQQIEERYIRNKERPKE